MSVLATRAAPELRAALNESCLIRGAALKLRQQDQKINLNYSNVIYIK